MKLSIIMPVYNEEKTIKEIIRRVLVAPLPPGWQKEIIIIDDASTDGTTKVIKSFEDEKIRIITHSKNQGKGAAIRSGLKKATGDALVIQDADLEYNPGDYQKLLVPIISQKARIVYGSRLKTLKFRIWGENKTPLPLHYLVNRWLTFLTNLLYGSKLTDMETGYKMMTKEVYRKLDLVSDRFEMEPEITIKILKMGYRITEIPITTCPRSYGEGKKIKAQDALKALWTLLKYRLAF